MCLYSIFHIKVLVNQERVETTHGVVYTEKATYRGTNRTGTGTLMSDVMYMQKWKQPLAAGGYIAVVVTHQCQMAAIRQDASSLARAIMSPLQAHLSDQTRHLQVHILPLKESVCLVIGIIRCACIPANVNNVVASSDRLSERIFQPLWCCIGQPQNKHKPIRMPPLSNCFGSAKAANKLFSGLSGL